MCMGWETGSLSLATHTHTHTHTHTGVHMHTHAHAHAHTHTHRHTKQLQCGPLVVAISDLSEDRPGRKKKESQ